MPIPEYYQLVHQVVEMGRPTPTRHGFATEFLGGTFVFQAGELVTRPGINRALGYMELIQILAGTFNLDALKRVAPRAQHSLFTPQMAYGPRVWKYDQWPKVVQALKDDPWTRQAVLFIGGREDGPTSDQPCTETIQFVIRDNRLITQVNMRSWDLIKGLSYDVIMFGGIALATGYVLGVPAGEVTVRAGSAHVYESDLLKVPPFGVEPPRQHFMLKNLPGTSVDVGAACRGLRSWAIIQMLDPNWLKGTPAWITEYIKEKN